MVDGIVDAIKSWFMSLIENVLYRIFFYIEAALLWLLSLAEKLMKLFTGDHPVTYNGKPTALVNVFFDNNSVKGVYGGIAMLGIVFSFIFAVVAVVKKLMDVRDKQQGVTLGAIVGNLVKSIVLIASMSFIMMVVLNITDVLLQQISYSFINANELAKGGATITFTDEQYAAMGRILNTVGNYSLNPSYRSRYNLNSCYNDIRTDLKYLGDQGVFRFHYVTEDENGNEIETWQSIMEELAVAYDYTQEAPLDAYDEGLTNAVLDTMELMRSNPNIAALDTYERKIQIKDSDVSLDRILFLTGTMGTIGTAAARNDAYNKNPSFADSVRQPFYYGAKSIYSWEQVKEVFSMSPVKMNYVLVYYAIWMILNEMVVIIVACGVRIFNLLALYIAAPLVIAAMPLDDGGKMKQWTTAFTVQLLGIVGLMISLRLFYMMLPLIWSPNLSVGGVDLSNFYDNFSFKTIGDAATKTAEIANMDLNSAGKAIAEVWSTAENILLTVFLKIILTYTALEAVSRMNGIFTGILADSAGYQSISAGDVRGAVEGTGFGQLMGKMSGKEALGKAFYDKEAEQEKKAEAKEAKAKKEQEAKEKAAEAKQAASEGRQQKMSELSDNIQTAQQTGKDANGKKVSDKDMDIMQGTLKHMQNSNMSEKDAKKAATKDYEKKQNNMQKNAKDLARLKENLGFANDTGRTLDGKEADGKERDLMAGTIKHMEEDGMNQKEARKAAEADYKKQEGETAKKNAFEKAELKAGPPNRQKAMETASKMNDDQYKAVKRDLAYLEKNGEHINGDEVKPGERGQMQEVLKQYEELHSGGGGYSNQIRPDTPLQDIEGPTIPNIMPNNEGSQIEDE